MTKEQSKRRVCKHRIRDRLVSRRTAVINQIRAFLLERGMVFAQRPAKPDSAMVFQQPTDL